MNSLKVKDNSNAAEPGNRSKETGSFKQTVLRLLTTSYAVWALIGLVGMDLLFSKLPFDRFATPNRSMAWWTLNDFKHQKTCPDVVLLGSSLLMHALHGGDAEYLNLPQNEVYHHKCMMFEDLLRKKTGVRVNSFAFAIAGTMASDAYSLCSTLFSAENKPRAIIYNIAPRDFIDNTLGSAASTETFRLMSQLGGVKDVAWDARKGFWEKVEFVCENASSLYKHRGYFVHLQQLYAKRLLQIAGYKSSDEVHTPFALRRLALLEYPEDIGSNERIACPGLVTKWTDNTQEYLRRYQPFKQQPFLAQCNYLDKMLSFCQQQGIEVVLVNMPLTPDNLKLLAPGSYDLYKKAVVALANKYNNQFIDMQDPERFDKSLYCDSAHMNGQGGVKYFKALADRLTDGSQLAIGRGSTWQ